MEKHKMTESQMYAFVDSINRNELHEELRDIYITKTQKGNSKYLKAIQASLIALGYDERWVNEEFRDLLEETYITPYLTKKIL